MKLLFDCIAKSPCNPLGLMRPFVESLKKEKSSLRISKEPGLLKWQEKVMACKSLDSNDAYEGLIRYFDAAVEYRRLHGNNMKAAKEFRDSASIIESGIKILELAYAVDATSLFGVVFLDILGLTADSITDMSLSDRVAFGVIMSPSLGKDSVLRLIPDQFSEVIDSIIDVAIPNLK